MPRRRPPPEARSEPSPFELECIAGLEQFAADEIRAVPGAVLTGRVSPYPPTPSPVREGGGARRAVLPSSVRDGGEDRGALLPSPAHGGGAGGRGSPSGAIRFTYAGPWSALLRLRTVVAVHAILASGLPRPTVLLDDGTFRRITATIGHIRSQHPAGAFRTFRLSAAGADSSVFQRFRTRLGEATGLRETSDAGDLLLRFRRGGDGRFELLVRISPRPLSARAWRVCNLPGALNAAVASVMAALSQPAADDVYLNLAAGSGTLLVERALLGPAGRLIGCDVDAEALDCAARNVAAAGLASVELADWDAIRMPLADGSVDALTVDLPFGQLVGSHATNAELYPALLAEAARVARRGARLVAITQQVRLLERSFDATRWSTETILRPTIPTNAGPIKPGIYVLHRL
jgi:tRNA (guanine6-N2)-methyltransferase